MRTTTNREVAETLRQALIVSFKGPAYIEYVGPLSYVRHCWPVLLTSSKRYRAVSETIKRSISGDTRSSRRTTRLETLECGMRGLDRVIDIAA